MDQPVGLRRFYRNEFVSFIWRAYPLARKGRGGTVVWGDQSAEYRCAAHASQAQSPLLAFNSLGEFDRLQPGQLRFIHQCFGILGELVAVVVVLAAVSATLIDPSVPFRRAEPRRPVQIQQDTIPNAEASPKPSSSTPLFDPNRLPQSQSRPAGPSEKAPNAAAEPETRNPRASPDFKADAPDRK